MAVSKELRPYLDKDKKNQYKKTRKNIAKLLTYYGYSIADIKEIFGIGNDYFVGYLDSGLLRREVATDIVYFTDEEKDIVGELLPKVSEVYKSKTGDVPKKRERVPVKVKKPYDSKKVSKPLADKLGEAFEEDLTSDTIKNPNLLSKLDKLTKTDTRDRVEKNREVIQKPVKSSKPTNGKCSLCENRGWIMEKQSDGRVKKVVCPQCLGNKVKVESVEFDRYGKPLLEELIGNKQYLSTSYNARTLMEDNMDAYRVSTRQFDNYLEFVNGLLTEVRSGDLPLKSYYLATPDGYGKKHLVYQCMKELVYYGHKPTQLLNGGLLLDLYNKREFKELNELLDGDMIFVTVSALSKTHGLGNVIKYIADLAERRGIPVLMIGRVSVEIFLRDKDYNVPSLLGRNTPNGDYGHFQCEGFFGKDFLALARLQQERMSGSLVKR